MSDRLRRLGLHGKPLRVTLIAVGVLAALVLTLPITLPGPLRRHLTTAISERFGGSVEMQALRVSIFPRLRVAGDGLTVRFKGQEGLPPLIQVGSFSADASLFHLLGSKVHLRKVYLDRLEVNVPPGGIDMNGDDDDEDDEDKEAPAPDATSEASGGPTGAAPDATGQAAAQAKDESPILIDEILAEQAVVRLLRRTQDKPAREFAIERLVMHDTGANYPWAFTTAMTNPTPPGRVDVDGTFGPWNADTPSQTPLAASYVFSNADLGVFNGIKGTLRSEGRFGGVLERIEVDGSVDVPDFAITDVDQPVHLQATFHSIVDGTNGNTLLQPVDATFGSTKLRATGGVVEVEGQHGRTVELDVVMDQARIEDVLRLAVKSKNEKPLMTGALKLNTKFELPPGPAKAIDKMKLDGKFRLDDARFGGPGVQGKINEMSRKAQDKDGAPEEVASDFSGTFVMGGGSIRFSHVGFTIPGAGVDLAGAYATGSRALDFKGTVKLDAKLSQLTSGFKSTFLKMIDPLFRKNNKTVIPITVGGTANDPKIGLDVKKAFTPK